MKNVLSIQSHVVYGHAGNSAAVFPMRRLGVDVWPLNTVQFSNHTQYKQWKGMVMPAPNLLEIVEGIDAIHQLQHCDAVLTGYIGSPEQGHCIVDIVKKVKKANPNAIYLCDPVMGHPEKGCIVAPGVAEFFCETALAISDVMAPNLLELEELTGRKINTPHEAIRAAKELCDKGPKLILVKYLSRAGFYPNKFEMLLVSKEETLHISRPLIEFDKQPVGVGDLTSGLLLANLLQGKSAVEALEHVSAAVYAVVMETKRRNQYELQLVAAQHEMASPSEYFKAKVLFD